MLFIYLFFTSFIFSRILDSDMLIPNATLGTFTPYATTKTLPARVDQ